MNPFDDLSHDNHDQIRKYLRFFRQKKDGIIRDIESEFADIRNDKLEETMFTKEDMLEYTDFLSSAIKVGASYPLVVFKATSNIFPARFVSVME